MFFIHLFLYYRFGISPELNALKFNGKLFYINIDLYSNDTRIVKNCSY